MRARKQPFEADGPRFRQEAQRGFKERWEALSAPLQTLREAGERGVTHFGIALTTDRWASDLAAELLAEMPSAPLRNRAMVEGLFLPGDRVPEVGERVARTLPREREWAVLEKLARSATMAGVELQSVCLTSLFKEGPDEELQRRPTADLERAALLLYDPVHHSALVAGLGFLLDPGFGGPGWVGRNLEEG